MNIKKPTHNFTDIQIIGAVLTVIGAAILLLYPLYPPDTSGPYGIPEPRLSLIMLGSMTVGPILITVGYYQYTKRKLRPLTENNAILAPFLSVMALVMGLCRYVYSWNKNTHAHNGGNSPKINRSLTYIVDAELGFDHLLSISVVLVFVAGVVAARKGFRKAAITMTTIFLLLGFIVLSVRVGGMTVLHVSNMVIITTVAFLVIPLGFGYYFANIKS